MQDGGKADILQDGGRESDIDRLGREILGGESDGFQPLQGARHPSRHLLPPDLLETPCYPFALLRLRLSAATKRYESREVPDPQVRRCCNTLSMGSSLYLYPRRVIPLYFHQLAPGVQGFEAEPDIFRFEETLEQGASCGDE